MTPNARAILDAWSKAQGIQTLNFDPDGLISIDLENLPIALGYRSDEDCFFVFGFVGPQSHFDDDKAWGIFDLNHDLFERGLRLAADPQSGGLVLVAEIRRPGLEFYQFEQRINDFVRTLTEHVAAEGQRSRDKTDLSEPAPEHDYVILRS